MPIESDMIRQREFIQLVAREAGLDEAVVSQVWRGIHETLSRKLQDRQVVEFPGFATITPVQRERSWGSEIRQHPRVRQIVKGDTHVKRRGIQLKKTPSAAAPPARTQPAIPASRHCITTVGDLT